LWRSHSFRDYQFYLMPAVAVFGPGTKISDAAIKILEILIGD
jgi:methylmalonyl-CoA mutase